MRTTITLALLLFSFAVAAQKIERAVRAYRDGDTDRAMELFRELAEKDGSDVAAVIGLAICERKSMEAASLAIPAEDLRRTIDRLISVKRDYERLSANDRKFVYLSFGISSTPDISNLAGRHSALLWNSHVSKTPYIAEVEQFQSGYLYASELRPLVQERLAELHYRRVSGMQSLSEYRGYLSRFPESVYARDVRRSIETLEYRETRPLRSPAAWEDFLRRYPQTVYRDTIHHELAVLIFERMDASDRHSIKEASEKLGRLPSFALRNRLLDSCENHLFAIESREVLASQDLNGLNAFLEKYADRNSSAIRQARGIRNRLWRQQLEAREDPDPAAVAEYIKATGATAAETDNLLTRLNTYISSLMRKAIQETLLQRIRSLVSDDDGRKADKAFRILYPIVRPSVALENATIFAQLKATTETDREEVVKEIVERAGPENIVRMRNAYFRTFGEEDEFLELVQAGDEGELAKTLFEYRGQEYQSLPTPATTYPIFGAIRKRYSINAFTRPEVRASDERGYIVRLYGYVSGNDACCPAYEIVMLFRRQDAVLVPVTAVTIDRHYGSIDREVDLNGYYRLDLQTLLEQEGHP